MTFDVISLYGRGTKAEGEIPRGNLTTFSPSPITVIPAQPAPHDNRGLESTLSFLLVPPAPYSFPPLEKEGHKGDFGLMASSMIIATLFSSKLTSLVVYYSEATIGFG
jgi:hypothetical protein